MTAPATHCRYIALTVYRNGLGGDWAAGSSAREACDRLPRRLRSYATVRIYRFDAQLPFAPPNRCAISGEAEAYLDRYGVMLWDCCERSLIYDGRPAGVDAQLAAV